MFVSVVFKLKRKISLSNIDYPFTLSDDESEFASEVCDMLSTCDKEGLIYNYVGDIYSDGYYLDILNHIFDYLEKEDVVGIILFDSDESSIHTILNERCYYGTTCYNMC